MAYRVEVSPAAARQLKKMDRQLVAAIAEKIETLAVDPRPQGCDKLRGYEGLYRVRVGDHRIIYGVEDRLVVVAILRVGNRADVYQRLRDSDVDFLRWLVGQEPGDTRPGG
jgi:mRNA interferase RelE/StbE